MYLKPSVEYKHISEWLLGLVGQHVSLRAFVRGMGRHLNRLHPVRVKLYIGDESSLDPGEFTIGAESDPNLDEQGRKQFIINFIVNHPKFTPWEITQDRAERMVLELVETLVHEYEHQQQYRARKFRLHRQKYVSQHEDPKIREQQEYLGDPDEISAYAANIAARYHVRTYELKESCTIGCSDLEQYYKAFDLGHEVIVKLLNKIDENIKYLKEHDDGKNHRRRHRRSGN